MSKADEVSDLHLVAQDLFQDMAKVRAFCAVGVNVLSPIVVLQEGLLEVKAGLLYFFPMMGRYVRRRGVP